MDMGLSTTDTAAMITSILEAPAATTSAMNMSSMSMGGDCKISMLWNWYTVDACFIAESWHITSHGMFAGSCIGVILLVMSLELLRRVSKEYDRHIVRQYQSSTVLAPEYISRAMNGSKHDLESESSEQRRPLTGNPAPMTFRPNAIQQAVRATLHMIQFFVAYFVMLLAMYFNGYLIICIVIGAWLGAFVFSWESVTLGDQKEEVTICCG